MNETGRDSTPGSGDACTYLDILDKPHLAGHPGPSMGRLYYVLYDKKSEI
jgi:hypothetical protein